MDIHIHDASRAHMMPKKLPVVAFLLLDVALLLCLLSMLFCLHPFKFDFVSEWMRQCKQDAHAYVLPWLLFSIIALVVQLQLNWMFLVSLHHLNAAARLDCHEAYKHIRHIHVLETRTRMLTKVICKTQEKASCKGHSDEAFMACTAAIVGMLTIVCFDWTSSSSDMHFYGVFLFCSGFFVILQIIWWNLQKASSVATLRHMKSIRGMHWAVDTVIVLASFVFLSTNFLLGETGALVVTSELIAFAFLMLQFEYLFYICCCNMPPQLPSRPSSTSVRLWFCLIIVSPFLLVGKI